jgi:copper chaperone CopZ
MLKKQIPVLIIFAMVLTIAAITASAVTKTVTISVEGMHCGGCATSIEKKLKATAGVEEVRVSFEKKEAWIKFDDQKITEAQLRDVITSTGYKVVDSPSAKN